MPDITLTRLKEGKMKWYQSRLLLFLLIKLNKTKGISICEFARKIRHMYSSTLMRLRFLESKGLVTITKRGRTNDVVVTDLGKEVCLKLNEIDLILR